MLIVFDRLFGTFAEPPKHELMQFGVRGRKPSNNPIRIALGEWLYLIRDASRGRGLRNRMRILFGPPH